MLWCICSLLSLPPSLASQITKYCCQRNSSTAISLLDQPPVSRLGGCGSQKDDAMESHQFPWEEVHEVVQWKVLVAMHQLQKRLVLELRIEVEHCQDLPPLERGSVMDYQLVQPQMHHCGDREVKVLLL